MSKDEVRTAVLAALARIAPEMDPRTLRPDVPVREQIDLDSMDFLNFLVEIHRALGVDVPETDYHEFTTLDGCVEYLVKRGIQPGTAPPAG
jgi:acyl carrier protein